MTGEQLFEILEQFGREHQIYSLIIGRDKPMNYYIWDELAKRICKNSSRPRKLCDICGEPNIYWYMVHDEMWQQANLDYKAQVCLPCLSSRLDRHLVISDFKHVAVNSAMFYMLDDVNAIIEIERKWRESSSEKSQVE